ncbi:MAG: hypothetical protein WCZ86_06200 [Desulfurivibrionaceae bacterium]
MTSSSDIAGIGVKLCALSSSSPWLALCWPVEGDHLEHWTGWTLNTAPVLARPLDAMDMILASRYIALAQRRGYGVIARFIGHDQAVLLCMAQLYGDARPLMEDMTAAQGMGVNGCLMQTARWTNGVPVFGSDFLAVATISGYKDPFIGGLSRVLDIVNEDDAKIESGPKPEEPPCS